jgi:hypothetical protein
MPRGLSLFFGVVLIIMGAMSFFDYFTIEPLWIRIVIIVIGGLSFITSLARRK